jgi:hypothetical protein
MNDIMITSKCRGCIISNDCLSSSRARKVSTRTDIERRADTVPLHQRLRSLLIKSLISDSERANGTNVTYLSTNPVRIGTVGIALEVRIYFLGRGLICPE